MNKLWLNLLLGTAVAALSLNVQAATRDLVFEDDEEEAVEAAPGEQTVAIKTTVLLTRNGEEPPFCPAPSSSPATRSSWSSPATLTAMYIGWPRAARANTPCSSPMPKPVWTMPSCATSSTRSLARALSALTTPRATRLCCASSQPRECPILTRQQALTSKTPPQSKTPRKRARPAIWSLKMKKMRT